MHLRISAKGQSQTFNAGMLSVETIVGRVYGNRINRESLRKAVEQAILTNQSQYFEGCSVEVGRMVKGAFTSKPERMVRFTKTRSFADKSEPRFVEYVANNRPSMTQIASDIYDQLGVDLSRSSIGRMINGVQPVSKGIECTYRDVDWPDETKSDDPVEETRQEVKTQTVTVKEKTTIFITTSKEFIHNFPAAGTNPKFATEDGLDVSFLAHPHRHMFGFRVETTVAHDDRDIEFIQLKRIVDAYLNSLPVDLGAMSCEMFAKQIIQQLSNVFGARWWKVTVDEDGENGATVESTPIVEHG